MQEYKLRPQLDFWFEMHLDLIRVDFFLFFYLYLQVINSM